LPVKLNIFRSSIPTTATGRIFELVGARLALPWARVPLGEASPLQKLPFNVYAHCCRSANVIKRSCFENNRVVYENALKQINTELARLDELRRTGTTKIDATATIVEVNELRQVMPWMNNDEKANLLNWLRLSAERKVRADSNQYLSVECIIGSDILPIPHSDAISDQFELSSSRRTN
jgi:hypothetical protein